MRMLRLVLIGWWILFSALEYPPLLGQENNMTRSFAELSDLEVLDLADHYTLFKHQPDSASWWLDRLMTRLDTLQPTPILARYYFERGQVEFYRQTMQAALDHAEAAISIFTGLEDSTNFHYADAYRLRAEMKKYMHGNFSETVADYQSAIALFEYQKDTSSYLTAVQTLAQLYGKHEFYELARAEREVVFHYAEEMSLHHILAVANLAQAIEYEIQGVIPPVLQHLKKAESAIEQVPELVYLEYYLNRFYLGHYYYAEEADSANHHFAKAEEAMTRLNQSERFQDNFERDRAMWHFINGRYDQAQELSLNSLKKARGRGEQNDILVNLELLKKINAATGEHQLAFSYAQEEMNLKDSIQKAVRLTQSIHYDNLYEKEKAASRQAQQQEALRVIEFENQEKIERYFLIGLIILLLLLSAYWYRNYRFQKENERLHKQFTHDLLLGRTEERKHIAMDLHDHIIHDLAHVKNKLLDRNDQADGDEMQQNITNVLRDLRGISLQLHDPSPELLGFNLAVSELVARFNREESIFYNFEPPEREIDLPLEIAGQVFAIIQEALRNLSRHSGARAAKVKMLNTDLKLEVSIIDNGRGFGQEVRNGIGLRSMRERANIIGAELSINSKPGGGTIVNFKYNHPV